MEVVILVEKRLVQLEGVVGAADGLLEVDDGIGFMRRANPGVEELTPLLVVVGVVAVALEGSDGGGVDAYAALVRFADDFPIDSDDVSCRGQGVA